MGGCWFSRPVDEDPGGHHNWYAHPRLQYTPDFVANARREFLATLPPSPPRGRAAGVQRRRPSPYTMRVRRHYERIARDNAFLASQPVSAQEETDAEPENTAIMDVNDETAREDLARFIGQQSAGGPTLDTSVTAILFLLQAAKTSLQLALQRMCDGERPQTGLWQPDHRRVRTIRRFIAGIRLPTSLLQHDMNASQARSGGLVLLDHTRAAGEACLDIARTCGRFFMDYAHAGGTISLDYAKDGAMISVVALKWTLKRLVTTIGAGVVVVGMGGLCYVLMKWQWALDRRASARVRDCGPTICKWLDSHDSGTCLYCRGATEVRYSEHMIEFEVPMMRCWGCWYKPAKARIWLHGGAFDRGMSIINRHRVKGDWTAGSEMASTHGAALREIPESLVNRTRHSEVVMIVAALNATTDFVTCFSRLDDTAGSASLIEPTGSVPNQTSGAGSSGDGGGSFEQTSGESQTGSSPASPEAPGPSDPPTATPPHPAPPAGEGAGLCLHDGHDANTEPADRQSDTRGNPNTAPTGASSSSAIAPPPGLESTSSGADYPSNVPFGTLGRGYDTVDVVQPLPEHVTLTPAEHPGPGRERQVVQSAVELATYNALKKDGGLQAGSRHLEEQRTNPQFMTIGSCVTEAALPHVAGSGPEIERAAIANRHFAVTRNKHGGITGVVQEQALPAIEQACDSVLKVLRKAGRVAKEFQVFPPGYDPGPSDAAAALHTRTTLLADFEYFAFVPGSWGTERGKTGFSKLPDTDEQVRQKHTFFVKLNEALRKIKPRLIQACGDGGCATHTFDAGFLEAIMFGITAIERRSVKHAGPEHLRARLAGLLKPFMNGRAISYDYGKFDSSDCIHKDDPRHSLKVLIENRIIKDLFGEDANTSDLSRQAIEDRCKTFLRSRSAFWLLYTKTYGRESGDRGTSCLNFLVNFVLFLTMMGMESAYRQAVRNFPQAASPQPGEHQWITPHVRAMKYDGAIVERFLRGEPCGFEIVAEGDDGLWLFTPKYIRDAPPGGYDAMADRFEYWSCMQGTNLEPQDETGDAVGPNRVQLTTRRMEHCSRIIVPYWSEVSTVVKAVPAGKKKKGKAKEAVDMSDSEFQSCADSEIVASVVEAGVRTSLNVCTKRTLRVGLLPKMRKTIEAADITFGLVSGVELSEQTMLNIAFTKFASCAFNCIDSPLMFQYFFMHARVCLLGDQGGTDLDKICEKSMRARFEYSAKNYVHKNMANTFGGKTSTLNEDVATELPVGPLKLLKMLWQRHERSITADGHVEAMTRAMKLECPMMDNDFIHEATAGMKATVTWEQCGEWSKQLKDRLGAV